MTTESATFQRAAKTLLRKITAYATSGDGDRKTELGLFKARDRLEDSMRRLGLTEDVPALALMLLVKQAASNAPDLARAARAEGARQRDQSARPGRGRSASLAHRKRTRRSTETLLRESHAERR